MKGLAVEAVELAEQPQGGARSAWGAWALGHPQRWAYGLVPAVLLVGLFWTAPDYGANIWITEVNKEFHPGQNWSMATGDFTYILSMDQFFKCSSLALMGSRAQAIMGRAWLYLLGTGLMCGGLALSGLAMANRHLALLYVGFGVLFPVGTACCYKPLVMLGLGWYRELGQPGLSAGILGLICGLWPATFAYFGDALSAWLGGVSPAFYALAVMVGITALPCVLLLDTPGDLREAVEPESEPVPSSDKLSRWELVRQRQFWALFAGLSLFMAPGFGIKLSVSPLLEAVFEADRSTQQAASALFLGSYAVARLVVGLAADRLPLVQLYVIFGCIQLCSCISLCLCLHWAHNDTWAFVVSSMLLGVSLAGAKVTISIVALQVWGAPSISNSFDLLLPTIGVAAVIGARAEGGWADWMGRSCFDVGGSYSSGYEKR